MWISNIVMQDHIAIKVSSIFFYGVERRVVLADVFLILRFYGQLVTIRHCLGDLMGGIIHHMLHES